MYGITKLIARNNYCYLMKYYYSCVVTSHRVCFCILILFVFFFGFLFFIANYKKNIDICLKIDRKTKQNFCLWWWSVLLCGDCTFWRQLLLLGRVAVCCKEII